MDGYYEYDTPLPSPAPHFDTFDDAWTALGQRWNALNMWGERAQDTVNGDLNAVEHIRQQQKLSNDFSGWESGFRTLRNMERPFTRREKCVSSLLECHLILAKQVLKTTPQIGEMIWDQTVEEFAEVVKLCRSVVDTEVGPTSTQEEQSSEVLRLQRYIPMNSTNRPEMPWVAFDMGIMPVLFHVVWKCRDARVRLNAIKILEQYPRLEFLWDGLLVARIARSIDMIERQGGQLEEAAARGSSVDEIPSWTRVLNMDVAMGTDVREVNLTYTRMEREGTDVVRINETITW
jgi:hypothetical protein